MRTTLKILQTFQVLQGKPLRIRPVISSCFLRRPGADKFETRIGEQIAEKWLPVIKQRKLASIIEIDSPDEGLDAESEDARSLALAAANLQFALRIRAQRNFCSAIVELAANAGATSFLTWPRAELLEAHALLRSNTVIAFPAVVDPDDSDPECGARFVRPLIDKGAAIAISMGPAAGNDFTRNMQHALHVACRNLKMTLEEAIVAATINAAYSLRTAHTTGSLEPGKSADLLVMDVPDYRELGRRPGMSNVEITMRAGQVVYRRPPLILD